MEAFLTVLVVLSFVCRLCFACAVYAAVKSLPALLWDFVPESADKLLIFRLPSRAWAVFALLCALFLVI